MTGLFHNLGSKMVHVFVEAIQGGTRVNPNKDVVGDGLAAVKEEPKYEDPNKDIIVEHDGAYVADDETPEHYICPLSGTVRACQ